MTLGKDKEGLEFTQMIISDCLPFYLALTLLTGPGVNFDPRGM